MRTIPEITVNGISLYYKTAGSGKPLYVLHGGPGFDHRYFKRSIAALETIRELYYIDFRGHGRSSPADRKTYTFDTFTSDIEAMRNALGHGCIDILGHSMGGLVGLLYSLQFSRRLGKLVLVGTVAKMNGITGHYPEKVKLLYLNLKYYVDYRIHKTINRHEFARDIMLMSWPIYVPETMRQEYVDYVNSIPDLTIFLDMQNELASYDVSDRLEAIQTPTLVIFGENDGFLQSGRLLKTIRHAKFSVIPEAKHLPFLEDEKNFNMVVREFLTTL